MEEEKRRSRSRLACSFEMQKEAEKEKENNRLAVHNDDHDKEQVRPETRQSAGGRPQQQLDARPHLRHSLAQTTSPTTSGVFHCSHINYVKSPQPRNLFASLLFLPLLFILLLPSLKLVDRKANSHSCDFHTRDHLRIMSDDQHPPRTADSLPTTSNLLLASLALILRLPLDRVRLTAGLVGVADAKPDLDQSLHPDLLEEETHMQLLLPAEHRSSSGGHGKQQANSPYLLSHYSPLTARSPVRTSADFGGYGGVAEAAAPASVHNDPSGVTAADYGDRSSSSGSGDTDTAVGQAVGSVEGGESLSLGAAALQARADLPAVRALNVKCEKNHMTVNIIFDRPFYGTVFSKGHYNDQKCVHLPASSGQTSVNFDIHLGKCGVTSSDASAHLLHGQQQQQVAAAQANGQQQQQPNGLYIENTIIIQYDPQVQEIYDQARKIRCTWYDYYEKSVSFRPYNVDMLDAVTANFLGDNIQCWMQIQVGKGPWSSEVAGIVKIGQTMTMVLAIKDDENRFDMLVRNCVAHDGKHQPIQLVDEYGCVARPKIIAKFQKVRNFGPAATVVSYAHFQAFKFPDSMSVNFQCVIQVCRYECPEPVCPGTTGAGSGSLEAASVASVSTSSNDYAASGTEIVSSKESIPGQAYFPMSNHSSLGGGGHSVNLKLDESQGRVQVKLDTSMLAGTRLGGNALPPHLLHAAGATLDPALLSNAPLPVGYAAPSGRAHSASSQFLSSSYYKPSVAAITRSSPVQQGNNGRPPTLRTPPNVHSHQRNPQYSPAYQGAASSISNQHLFPGNRLGELAGFVAANDDDLASATELASPLSLMARPRGLHSIPTLSLPTSTTQATRLKRSLASSTVAPPNSGGKNYRDSQNNHQRSSRSEQETTAIQTQKSIQVVSPDDVAFSLLGDEYEPLHLDGSSSSSSSRRFPNADQQQQQQQQHRSGSAMVCFSAGKLLLGVLTSLSVLIAGLMLAGYLLYLRERSRSGESKLDQFEHPMHRERAASFASCGPEQLQSGVTSGPLLATPSAVSSQRHQQVVASAQLVDEHEHEHQHQHQHRVMLARRQQEEIQQRNNYLARLYSQFVPAAYTWRQQ